MQNNMKGEKQVVYTVLYCDIQVLYGVHTVTCMVFIIACKGTFIFLYQKCLRPSKRQIS